jgi:hypothetical protein
VFSFSSFVVLAFLPSWGAIVFSVWVSAQLDRVFFPSFQTIDSHAFAIIIGLAVGNFSFF